jgi:3-oxoacyl-(acyl-carrier-protein) synthase
VITGVGLGTCLGVGATRVWQRILNGESGISVLRTEDPRFRTAPSIVGESVSTLYSAYSAYLYICDLLCFPN